jgi:hypothetical protein
VGYLERVGESIYRVPAPKPLAPLDPYLSAWASLRRRRVVMLISGLAIVVSVMAMPFLGSLSAFIVFPLMATFSVSWLMAGYFRCPHCRQAFAKGDTAHESFARSCGHCGIRVGTPRSAVVADATGA